MHAQEATKDSMVGSEVEASFWEEPVLERPGGRRGPVQGRRLSQSSLWGKVVDKTNKLTS